MPPMDFCSIYESLATPGLTKSLDKCLYYPIMEYERTFAYRC